MKPDIWMPLFIGDYLADTMHLTTTQHGAFLLLLLHAWRTGGYLPDNDATLAAITRTSVEDWQNNRTVIVGLLEKHDSGLCYPPQVRELEKAAHRSNVGFSNGIKGGRPKNNPIETQPITQTKPNSKPKPNPNETSLPSPLPLPSHTPVPSPAPSEKERESGAASPPLAPAAVAARKPEATPSSLETVVTYGKTIRLTTTECEKFYDHFTANGWRQGGRTPIKDWQAALRNWKRRAKDFGGEPEAKPARTDEEWNRLITEAWEQDNGPDLVRRAKEQAAREQAAKEKAEKEQGGQL